MGVEPGASKDEIRDAYRNRLDDLKVQAENGRSDKIRDAARAETRELNRAWQVLSDPFQRERYDDVARRRVRSPATTTVCSTSRRRRATVRRRRRPPGGCGACSSPGRPPPAPSAAAAPASPDPAPSAVHRKGVEGAEAAPLGRRLAAMGIDLADGRRPLPRDREPGGPAARPRRQRGRVRRGRDLVGVHRVLPVLRGVDGAHRRRRSGSGSRT